MLCDFCKENIDEAFEGDLIRTQINGYNKKVCNECYDKYITKEDKRIEEEYNRIMGIT